MFTTHVQTLSLHSQGWALSGIIVIHVQNMIDHDVWWKMMVTLSTFRLGRTVLGHPAHMDVLNFKKGACFGNVLKCTHGLGTLACVLLWCIGLHTWHARACHVFVNFGLFFGKASFAFGLAWCIQGAIWLVSQSVNRRLKAQKLRASSGMLWNSLNAG